MFLAFGRKEPSPLADGNDDESVRKRFVRGFIRPDGFTSAIWTPSGALVLFASATACLYNFPAQVRFVAEQSDQGLPWKSKLRFLHSGAICFAVMNVNEQ